MPSGLLYDWALPLIALELYDGLPPNDTNIIGKVGYRMAYAALYDADLMQTGILPDPAEHIGIAIESDTLSYKMLLYRYDTFKEDAITNGLVDTLNSQLYDVPNRPDNPYASKEVFMAVPWSKTAIFMGKYYFTSDISASR